MFFKFYFIFYCVLVRVTVYVGCLSGVINDDDETMITDEYKLYTSPGGGRSNHDVSLCRYYVIFRRCLVS